MSGRFAIGELCSGAVASDALRPHLLSSGGLPLVLDACEALILGLEAPPLELRYFAVPQYAPLIEAAASIGQALKAQPLASLGEHADRVSAVLMALAAALSALQHRCATEEHVTLGISNDVQAAVALARLGIGTDARETPLPEAIGAPAPLAIPLMGKSQFPGLKFTVRNT